jgi:cytochrome c peroxidase
MPRTRWHALRPCSAVAVTHGRSGFRAICGFQITPLNAASHPKANEEKTMRTLKACVTATLLLAAGTMFDAHTAAGQVPALSTVSIPRPSNLGDFVRDEKAAEVLGKAFFWDMQVGSDGVQACATCHFRAGADPRAKNQVSPGLLRVRFPANGPVVPDPDLDFSAGTASQGPNYTLKPSDFPLRKLVDTKNRESAIASDSNNVVSSQGVHYGIYGENGYTADPDGFSIGGVNVRRVEPRNTPTMINAVFNHRNFWDMRAQNIFNGVNPFGLRDPSAFLYRADSPDNPQQVRVSLDNSSLASQAVGPPTNRFEMSVDGRNFPDVGRALVLEIAQRNRDAGKRLKNVRPLAKQLVHRDDSVLGPFSRSPEPGLHPNYEALIRQAFQPRWWSSTKLIRVASDGTTSVVDAASGAQTSADFTDFTLLEYNFSLFFGLAVQVYEATLVSDDTPFDRFLRDRVNAPLSEAAERGRKAFFNEASAPRANCLFCHSGALLSEASVVTIADPANGMVRVSGGQRSDRGTRNIGVRETTDDLGNGGTDPFGNPLSVAAGDPLPGSVLAADGTFKIPGLRNVELTAPYFHNGGELTLLDVVKFYARGGNQGGTTNRILTRDGVEIGGLSVLSFNNAPNAEDVMADLVAFLKTLTDERVRIAAAPFDHPQLFVPNGHKGDERSVTGKDGQAVDQMLEIPATGRTGRKGRKGSPELPGFLEVP